MAILVAGTSIAMGADRPQEEPESITLEADLISAVPESGEVVATGNVSLHGGDLSMTCSSLILREDGVVIPIPPFLITGGGLALSGSGGFLSPSTGVMRIELPDLQIADAGVRANGETLECRGRECRIKKARGTACPHHPTGYWIAADEITLHESGDLDLRRPKLVVDGTPVAWLPWIRIRPPDKPGFLAPRLGYDRDGGLVIGPAGHLPLGDDLVAQGHVAARTSQGLEASTRLISDRARLQVDYLLDAPDSHGRVRLETSHPLVGVDLNTSVDLADHRMIVDTLASHPLERAISHTESRALLFAGSNDFLVETGLSFAQGFDSSGLAARALAVPVVTLSVSLPPLPSRSPLWPALELGLRRIDNAGAAIISDASGLSAPSHTRVHVSPALFSQGSIGPFATALRLQSDHTAWLLDGSNRQVPYRHALLGEARTELPILGQPRGLQHLLIPFAAYRIVPWTKGESPGWAFDHRDSLITGQGLEAGMSTTLGGADRDLIDLEIFQRIDLPGFGNDASLAYLFSQLDLGPDWLKVSAAGSLDTQLASLSAARLALSSLDPSGSMIELGVSWYGPGRGAHQDGRMIATTIPLFMLDGMSEPARAMELFQQARVAFTRSVAGVAGARVGIIPSPSMHAIWYGLEIGPSCGCIMVGIVASHRPDSAVPDVMATLRMGTI